jgi:hypothetical protein
MPVKPQLKQKLRETPQEALLGDLTLKMPGEEIDRPPDRVVDGVEIYIHHVKPTPEEERRELEFWRQMVALVQNRQESETRIEDQS